MKIRAVRTGIFREGDDLFTFITKYVRSVPNKSVLVITSKVVAVAEGRVEEKVDEKTRERLIRQESQWAMKTKWTWLTVKDNMVMSSAGIDESNADGKIILLPKDSFKTARELRLRLMKHYKVKKFGILITDSRLFPLRAGIVGVALGYAGFRGVRDYRRTRDIFGRKLKMSRTDIADSLATVAVMEMGEGAEQQPLAVITGARVEFVDKVNRRELIMDFRDDVYAALFQNIKKMRMKKIKGPWSISK